MTPDEKMRNAASKIRALPVDVSETALCEHQTGLMLTDAPQALPIPSDPVMEEVEALLQWIAQNDDVGDMMFSRRGPFAKKALAALALIKRPAP